MKKYLIRLVIIVLIIVAVISQGRLTGKVILQNDSEITDLRVNDINITNQVIIDSLSEILTEYEYDIRRSEETYLDDETEYYNKV